MKNNFFMTRKGSIIVASILTVLLVVVGFTTYSRTIENLEKKAIVTVINNIESGYLRSCARENGANGDYMLCNQTLSFDEGDELTGSLTFPGGIVVNLRDFVLVIDSLDETSSDAYGFTYSIRSLNTNKMFSRTDNANFGETVENSDISKSK